jgi:hypothetical protein
VRELAESALVQGLHHEIDALEGGVMVVVAVQAAESTGRPVM